MARGRHASRHSRPSGATRGSGKNVRLRKSKWLAWVTVFAVLTGFVVQRAAQRFEGAADQSAMNCPAPPQLSADSSATTLLGSTASNPSTLAQATAQFGHMPIIRVFYSGLPSPNAWTSGAGGINKSAAVVSFNALPNAILSGADDAALSHFFDTAPTGHPIYYSYYHEPEVHIADGQFTLASYLAAWARVVSLADGAHNPDLHSTLILTSWDLNPHSGRNWKNYLPPGGIISTLGWDAYPAGTVSDHDPQATPPADFMSAEVAAAKSAGLPFGFAEFALGTQAGRPGWLTDVASYLQSSGALFGTLFESAGFPWMELNDAASVSAWRSAVAHSDADLPVATAPSGSSSPRPPAESPQPAPATAPAPTHSVLPAGLVITNAAVRPATFAFTGKDHVRIKFKISQEASISICVLNSQGTAVRQLVSGRSQSAGWSSSWYFGFDQHGRLLPAGRYSVLIAASNAKGSATAQTVLSVQPAQAAQAGTDAGAGS